MTKSMSSKAASKTPSARPKAKAPPVVELAPWAALTQDQCINSLRTASHLSSKSVNTNAAAVGVRIASGEKLSLPYVAVRTLGADAVPVDYITGATDSPTLKKIVSAMAGVETTLYKDIPDGQVAMIHGLRHHMQSSAKNGVQIVDPRLRQIIFPGDPESAAPWVALTPLQSSGLSYVIAKRRRTESDSSIDPITGKSTISRATAIFGVGGSKPQNVGMYGKYMGEPLVFFGPTEDKDVRAAYAIHFSGHLRDGRLAPKRETLAFALWRHAQTLGNTRAMPTGMEIRKTEAQHIRAIAAAAVAEARNAHDLLRMHQEMLEGLTTEDLDPFLRALIDPALRNRDFKKTFSQKLIKSIERFEFEVGKGRHVVGGDGDLASLVAVVEEVAL